jgi:hypothetical protein
MPDGRMTVTKKKTPAPQRAGTERRRQAIRIARALKWDAAAIDAVTSLLERIQEISARPVRKTNQKG